MERSTRNLEAIKGSVLSILNQSNTSLLNQQLCVAIQLEYFNILF